MADPTTLKALADSNLNAWDARTTAARNESAAAQAALAKATADRAAATQALADANAEAARIRAALAAAATSADAAPLLQEIDAIAVDQRAAEAAILAADRVLALARDRQERATQTARAAEAGRVRAAAEAQAADTEAKRIAALIAALAEPPLDTLVQDAADLLASQTAADAQTAAERDLPTVLLARARERVVIARERIENLASSRDAFAARLQALVDAAGSSADRLAVPRAAYASALAALEGYVGGAKERFDRAQAALARLADPAQKTVLTAAQAAQLNDIDLADDRETAAEHEHDLDLARRDRELAEQERDLEQAKKAAGEPEDLASKQAALATKTDAETDARDAHPADERALLSAWEAAAPDWAWADLAAFDDAIANLTDLKDRPPAPLVPTLTAKEAALVDALLDLGKEQAARDLYAAELAARSAAAQFDAGAAGRIAFAALRGDG